MSKFVTGLHSANWIIPDHFLAMARPLSRELQRLAELGVTTIISLLEEAPDTSEAALSGLCYMHLPYADMTPPSEELIEEFVRIVNEQIACGGVVAVHCHAGLGRTGTLAACYLVSNGMEANEAIDQVRQMRPGSVQTHSQEKAIEAYACRRGEM